MQTRTLVRSLRRLTVVAVVLAVLVLAGRPAPISAQTPPSWLDEATPANWNSPGMAVPQAAPLDPSTDPRFLARNRPPETAADDVLVAAGWQLIGSYQGGWGSQIITATSGYDGMGRPMGFQTFVFSGGQFAGTLSPVLMNSRFDGALDRVNFFGPDQITAEYRRYAGSDPLCCPSGQASAQFRLEQTDQGPVVVPVSTTSRFGAAAGPPAAPSDAFAAVRDYSWLWQGTQMSDGATYTPADPSRFSIGFHADGRFNLRADCNVGNGRYQVDGDQLSLTPLALTRAACPPESLDSDYLRQLGQVSRYYLLGDDLILEFPVDSGTMRFSRVVGE